MKQIVLLIIALGSSAIFLNAQTTVSGNQKGIWTFANSPYIVNGTVTVKAGDTLTIQPGVVVQMPSVFLGTPPTISVEGKLTAVGTSTQRINFKADKYTAGNNTSGPITIQASSLNSKIEYATFDSLGASWIGSNSASLIVNSLTCNINNCIFQNTSGTALILNVPTQKLNNNSFFYNSYLDVSTNPDNIRNIVGSNPLRFGLLSGMAANDTLTSYNTSYRLLQEVRVPTGKTLTIQPGVQLIFPDYFILGGVLTIQGSLKAIGTTTNPIKFTGDHTSSSYSNGPITIEASSNYSELQYVTISNLLTTNYGPTDGALFVRSSYAIIKNCTIQNNLGVAIKVENNATPTISSNTFFANQYGDIYGAPVSFTNVTKNTDAQMNISAGNVTVNSVWPVQSGNFQYFLKGSVKVNSGVTLTIPPGNKIDFTDNNGNINVDGTLIALGTSRKKISFTRPNGAYGGKLSFSSLSSGSSLKYLILNRLGSVQSPSNGVAMEINTNSIAIDNLTIAGSNDTALSIINGSPVITNSVFQLNKNGVVSKKGKSVFTNCQFINNKFGLRNISLVSTDTVDARNCWWNRSTGPRIATNPTGTGDSVSLKVLYNPFLTVKPSFANNALNVYTQSSIGATKKSALIYPNPTSANATLTLSNKNERVTVKVTDASGKVVWQTSSADNSITIPSAKFASGVYVVNVVSGSGVETVKLVKE